MNWLPWYHRPTRSAKPPGCHVLVYDSDCGFCRASVAFIQRYARTSVTLIPFAELDQEEMLTTLAWPQVLRSAHYITPEGNEYHGGESILRAFRLLPAGAALAVFQLWGLALVRELVYGLVANNRPLFSSLTSLVLRRNALVTCLTERPNHVLNTPTLPVYQRETAACDQQRVCCAQFPEERVDMYNHVRIRVVGMPGAGKTTVGLALAQGLQVPLLELDGLSWHPANPSLLKKHLHEPSCPKLERFLYDNPSWVISGNHLDWSGHTLSLSTFVVLLDVPARVSLWRSFRRFLFHPRWSYPGFLIYMLTFRRRLMPLLLQDLHTAKVPYERCTNEQEVARLLRRFPGSYRAYLGKLA